MIEASATFSAFVGFEFFLPSLLDFLFPMRQCVPTAAVSLSALAYELAHELGVSNLCTVRVAYMVYPARLRSALRCWLACIGCSVMEGGILLFNALPTLPKPRKVAAFVLWCDLTPSLLSIIILCYISHLPYLGWDITGFKRPCAYICFLDPVISRLACLRDIFSRGCHGNGVYVI